MTSTLERIAERTVVTPSGCFEFQYTLPNGYGYMSVAGKDRRVHRVAYELLVGPVPAGLQLDHLCRNKACWNVGEHIEAVTARENTVRGKSPAAINARKEKCVRGHSFDKANTYVYPSGKRECRTCQRKRKATRRAAQVD